ncbi:MAG TPA: ANTAR domain-containing protein [Jatrophihabitans sp.]|jgi:AmiR/NasT family two-component response regulator
MADIQHHSTRTPTAFEANDPLAAAEAKIANLEVALRSSRVIGTAVGILVERHKISPDTAFDFLVKASQCENRKLRDVAEDLVYSGELHPKSGSAFTESA